MSEDKKQKKVAKKSVVTKAKKDVPVDDRDKVESGMIVSVYEKVVDVNNKGEKKERVQVFKGMVLARKHGKEPGASITVRKQSDGVGVEKIFPIYSPLLEKIIINQRFKVRRSKLYFLRTIKKRLKAIRQG